MTPRAETVGSLLRPPYLAEARAAHDAGTISADDLRAVEDRAVDEAIALQEACGLDIVSDGEMRRGVFTGSLLDAIEGIDGPASPADDVARRRRVRHRGPDAHGRAALGQRDAAARALGRRARSTRTCATAPSFPRRRRCPAR